MKEMRYTIINTMLTWIAWNPGMCPCIVCIKCVCVCVCVCVLVCIVCVLCVYFCVCMCMCMCVSEWVSEWVREHVFCCVWQSVIYNKIIVVNLTHKIMYSTTFACLLGAMLDISTTFAQHLITQVTKYCDDLFWKSCKIAFSYIVPVCIYYRVRQCLATVVCAMQVV